MIWRRYGGVIVAVAVLAIFVYLAADTQRWSPRARLFSQVIAAPALGLAMLQIVREARRARAGSVIGGPDEAVVGGRAALWLVAFFVSVFTMGLLVTVPLFAIAYLRFEARFSLLVTLVYAVIATVFVWGIFGALLHIPLPKGVIGSSLPGLP